jgi:hypothetical protein
MMLSIVPAHDLADKLLFIVFIYYQPSTILSSISPFKPLIGEDGPRILFRENRNSPAFPKVAGFSAQEPPDRFSFAESDKTHAAHGSLPRFLYPG